MESNFYGNTTNASRTQFNFDRIYKNRRLMDANAHFDGVFVGRYVLIEYGYEEDDNDYLELIKIGNLFYYKDSNLQAYVDSNEKGTLVEGTLCYVNENGNKIYYIAREDGFVKINKGNSNPYTDNYEADNEEYGRGFDSTVWQKVYINNTEKYIMIAELNIPDIKIVTEPPTLISEDIQLERDENGYNLHLPTTWDFKIKEKSDGQYSDQNDKDGNPIAIYYNKKAFENFSFNLVNHEYKPGQYYYKVDTTYSIANSINFNNVYYIFDNGKYYPIKFLKDNEYFWSERTAEKPFYCYSGIQEIKLSNNEEERKAQIEEYKSNDEVYDFYIMNNRSYVSIDVSELFTDESATYYYSTYEIAKDNDYENKTIFIRNKDSDSYFYDIIYIIDELPLNENEIVKVRYNELKSYYNKINEHYEIDNGPYDPNKIYYEDSNGRNEVLFNKDAFIPYFHYLKDVIYKDKNGNIYSSINPLEIYENNEIIFTDKYIETINDYDKYDRYYLGRKEIDQNIEYFEKVNYEQVHELENEIKFEEGRSEKEYNGTKENEEDIKDTKELIVNLPSIGNAIAELYDILYGKDRNTVLYSVPYKVDEYFDGQNKPLYNTDESSLVGLMNRVSDLIGHDVVKVDCTDIRNQVNDVIETIKDIYGEDIDVTTKLIYNINDGVDEKGYYRIKKQKIEDSNDSYWLEYFVTPESIDTLIGVLLKIENIFEGKTDPLFEEFAEHIKLQSTNDAITIEDQDQGYGFDWKVSHKKSTIPNLEKDESIKGIIYDNNDKPKVQDITYRYDSYGHLSSMDEGETKQLPQAVIASEPPKNVPIGTLWYDISS